MDDTPRMIKNSALKVVGAVAPSPWSSIAVAAEAVLDLLAKGQSLEEQATQARKLASTIRRQQSGRELVATRLVDLVAAEFRQADTLPDVDTSWVSEVLTQNEESLAGLIGRHLQEDQNLDVATLEHAIGNWFFYRLRKIDPSRAARISAALARRVLGALNLESSFREQVKETQGKRQAEAFLKSLDQLGRELVTRIGCLERGIDELGDGHQEILTSIQALRDELAKRAGVPSEAELQKFLEAARKVNGPTKHRERLNEQLCRPENWVPDEPVPDHFSYLEHGLRSRVFSKDSGKEIGSDWSPMALDKLIDTLCQRGPAACRVLLLARAGFGKSTFVEYLAEKISQRAGMLVPPVVSFRDWDASPRDITIDGLMEFVCERIGGAWETPEERRKRLVELVRQGRVLLIVDGLDQVGGKQGKFAEDVLPPREGAIRLLATCREEVAGDSRPHEYDFVVQLREPDIDSAPEQLLPSEVKSWLERWVPDRNSGGDGAEGSWAHPFWIHVARYVWFKNNHGLPAEGGVSAVLKRYLEQVLGAACDREGVERLRRKKVIDQARRFLAAAAWASLARVIDEEQDGSGPPMQELPWLVLESIEGEFPTDDEVQRVATECSGGLSDPKCALPLTEECALLLTERSNSREVPVLVFQHQLVQEYLAAAAIAARVQDEEDPERRPGVLEAQVEEILQPRKVRKYCFVGTVKTLEDRLAPIEDRIRALRLWSFVAELLAGELETSDIKNLVQRLSSRLFNDLPEEPTHRTALLRLRDELLGRVALGPESPNRGDDPIFDQFTKADDPVDSFMILLWPEEEKRIQSQVKAWMDQTGHTLTTLAEALSAEDGKDWQVEPYGATLAAFKDDEEPTWLLVPPGPFIAGSWEETDEGPVCLEQTGPFWVARDPVTVGEFKTFIKAGGYDPDAEWWAPFAEEAQKVLGVRRTPGGWDENQKGKPHRPVVGISWFEAAAYCRWKCFYRLPTEAEWEKAARGLFGRRWPWGGVWQPELVVCEGGKSGARGSVMAVEENPNRSPFGARGMAGNCWEWCANRWDDHRFGEELITEKGVGKVKYRDSISLRGGSFLLVPVSVRCAYRNWILAGDWGVIIGFRCVRDVK